MTKKLEGAGLSMVHYHPVSQFWGPGLNWMSLAAGLKLSKAASAAMREDGHQFTVNVDLLAIQATSPQVYSRYVSICRCVCVYIYICRNTQNIHKQKHTEALTYD